MAFVEADPGIVELLADAHIEQLLAEGELVRSEDLAVGKYEFQPIGKVEQLELAIDAALDALQKGNVRDAVVHLESTFPPEEPDDLDDDTVDAEVIEDEPPAQDLETPALGPGDPDPAPEGEGEPGPRRRHRPPPADPDAEPVDGAPAAEGRPAEMPYLDRSYECVGVDVEGNVCGAIVPGAKAQFSFIRFQKVLCSTGCLPHYNQATGIVEPGVDDDADVD